MIERHDDGHDGAVGNDLGDPPFERRYFCTHATPMPTQTTPEKDHNAFEWRAGVSLLQAVEYLLLAHACLEWTDICE